MEWLGAHSAVILQCEFGYSQTSTRFVEVKDDSYATEQGNEDNEGEYEEVDVEHIVTYAAYAVEQDLDVEDFADDLADLYQADLNPSLDSDTPKSALSQF